MLTDDAPHILVIDDDRRLSDLLRKYLSDNGFRVTVAAEAGEARQRMSGLRFDLLVLDRMMPGESGLDFAKSLRTTDSVPILMLTAMDEVDARIDGLEAGVDDYLAKPFALDELLARVRALLRRNRSLESQSEEAPLCFGDLSLDRQARQAHRDGQLLELTRTEYELLELFLEHPNQVLTRDQIYEAVWGYDSALASNSLEVYVGYLRRKTEAGGSQRLIRTVRGIGYVLRSS